MPSTEFTCDRCGYRSEHLFVICPNCGKARFGEGEEAGSLHLNEEISVTPGDPPVKANPGLYALKVLQGFCGVGVILFFAMFIPCFIIPWALGPDSHGYYAFPATRSRTPMLMSQSVMLGVNLFNAVMVILSAGVYLYLKQRIRHKESTAEI